MSFKNSSHKRTYQPRQTYSEGNSNSNSSNNFSQWRNSDNRSNPNNRNIGNYQVIQPFNLKDDSDIENIHNSNTQDNIALRKNNSSRNNNSNNEVQEEMRRNYDEWRQIKQTKYCPFEERCKFGRYKCKFLHDYFYWFLVKNQKYLLIDSQTRMYECAQTCSHNKQLPPYLEINMEKIFDLTQKIKGGKLAEYDNQLEFDLDIIEDNSSDYYQLNINCQLYNGVIISTWKDTPLCNTVFMKMIKPFQSNQVVEINNLISQLIRSMSNQKLHTLSIILDARANLATLRIVKLDFIPNKQNEILDTSYEYLQMIKYVPCLEKLKLLIRQDQSFNHHIYDYINEQSHSNNIIIKIHVKFTPNKEMARKFLQFIEGCDQIQLTFNWNCLPPSLYHLENVFCILQQLNINVKRLSMRYSSFRCNLDNNKLSKINEIVNLGIQYKYNHIKLGNAFLDYLINKDIQEDELSKQLKIQSSLIVSSLLNNLTTSYNNILSIIISPDNLLMCESMLLRCRFSRLSIDIGKDNPEQQVKALNMIASLEDIKSQIFIKLEYLLPKKYNSYLLALVKAISNFNNHYEIDLTISSISINKKYPENQLELPTAIGLIKNMFSFNKFSITYKAQFLLNYFSYFIIFLCAMKKYCTEASN